MYSKPKYRPIHLLAYRLHIVVYSCSAYNPKFGGDWPITDRQMMALNVNQEILLELMEMSPELIEELYSRNVLTKRHKDFISGQLSELKKSETFLDILRRRSFRDYKETIKCLRASKQTHIAEILEGGGNLLLSTTYFYQNLSMFQSGFGRMQGRTQIL